MNPLFDGVSGARLRVAILAAVVLLAVFLGIKAVGELMGLRYVGSGTPPTNTISISGEGEAVGVPDVAMFTFTVMSEKATVAAAQDDVTTKANAITDSLKGAGIEERDIKTTDYSVYPQYDYISTVCIAGQICPPGEQRLRGYQVRQTTTVKVRNTEQAGELLTSVGGQGATEVSGLNFTFDDPDAVQNEARNEAIADAKEKADALADALGVRIVRVVSFYENGGGWPMPYASYDMMAQNGMGGAESAAVRTAPAISVGENKVISNVTVTYEIR